VDISAISARPGRVPTCPGRVPNRPEGGSIEDLSKEKEDELLARTPTGEVPRFNFPTEGVHEQIVEWRPIVDKSEPLAAILQLVLVSEKRDDKADDNIDLPCTGIPLFHELILAAFGFHSRQHAYKHGVTASVLVDLYRSRMDSDFYVSSWNKEQDRARVLLAHSIPIHIIEAVEEHMLSPDEADDTTRLIGGNSGDRRNNGVSYDIREQAVEDHEPEIDLPPFTKRMQTYLNGLRQQSFSRSDRGFVGAKINEAIETARNEFTDAQRRRQSLRKLFTLRHHPKPLYMGCDFFSRLKAEGHNQLMNLPSKLLHSLYTDRDREVDLSKAHLACEVPLAEKNGIDATLLREYLERNRRDENFDLWLDVAQRFKVDDMGAARATAKKLYSAPYGSSEKNLLKEMCWAYEDMTGRQDGTDPFKPVLEHPLVDELFRMREEFKELITGRGWLKDAAGRKIRPAMMTHKNDGAWKSVLAYTNSSFEQRLMAPIFDLAIEEQDRSRPRFAVWLYQGDGVTIRVKSRASTSHQVDRLQSAVTEEAEELGVPTELEVDWPE
jgi:hypothetical protein